MEHCPYFSFILRSTVYCVSESFTLWLVLWIYDGVDGAMKIFIGSFGIFGRKWRHIYREANMVAYFLAKQRAQGLMSDFCDASSIQGRIQG